LFWLAFAVPATAETPLPSSFQPPVPYLGKHPELPAQPAQKPLSPLQAATQATGFTVTTTSREQSRNFFNALYPASDNVPIGWTGNLAACSAGTTTASFKDAVQLRVNYFRAMAGVPAAITFSDIYSGKSQQTALMMSRNNTLNHYPPSSWSCYSTDGHEAAGNSNLALGFFGAEAVSGYVLDHGDNNAAAGHRRWLLYPQTQVMGTGDIPVTTGYTSANSLWVFDGNYGSPRPATRDDFVAWPPPGYVPYQVVYPRWSLSYPGANFSNATVSMTRNGVTLPVRLEPLTTNVGENSLIWIPDNLDTNSADSFARPAADTAYAVTVNNVLVDGSPRSFSYTVTLFDPQTPGADHVSAAVTGPSSPAVGMANPYSITSVPGADSYQWRYGVTTATGTYGAENGLSGITVTVPSGYSPISTDVYATGSASYHLTHPDFTDQVLSLDAMLLPGNPATLTFQSRLGIATAAQTATVEVSTDDGATWQEVYRQTGSGNPGETTFTRRTINLAPFADRTVRIRFVYRYTMGESAYTQTTTGFGWYLDDISFTDSRELSGTTVSPTMPSSAFDFTPPAEGSLILQARALLYGRYPLEWGSVLRVTASASSLLSLACTISGTGGGKVMSTPVGISCPYEICTFLFPPDSPVSLTAYPDTNSLFGGWTGGGCGGTGDCSVPMTSATSVNARFNYVLPVRVPLAAPPEYSSLTLAYGAVPDKGTILARAFIFTENLLLTLNKRVYLRGGYDTGFNGTIGTSVLNGRLTISQGSLVVTGLVIR
jgi:uncharacterized protein YkwD